MFNFEDYFNTWGDLFKFNYEYKSTTYNWDELKKQGKVEETTEEKNGFKTITRTFISKDGSQRITQSETFPVIDEIKQKLISLDKQIYDAVKKEDYETAAKLKKEKEILTNKKSK